MLKRLGTWMKAEEGGATSVRRLRRRLFWTALIVRLLYILVAHTYHVRPANDHFQFAWETGRIARALATGYGYADPFAGHTGPTAWAPPLFPLLLAGIFKIFGVYSNGSAFAILALDSVFSAAIAPAVHEIAHRCYDSRGAGRRVALWSGWLWALYPAALQYAVHWIWEMSLTTCAFAWVLVIALRLRRIGDDDTGPARNETLLWAAYGLLWGVIWLANPSLVLALPLSGLWMLFGAKERIRSGMTGAAVATLLFLCCLAPWVYRNWVVFHAFIPTRSNLGAEFYQSLLPSNNGFPWGTTVPAIAHDPELERYRSMGEMAWVRGQSEKAHALFHAYPSRFVDYSLKRIYFFWVSVPKPPEKGILLEAGREMNYCFLSLAGLLGLLLSLHRRIPAAGFFAAIVLVLPLPYYFLTVQARFRHPLEPLLTIFAVYLFQSTSSRKTSRSRIQAT